jgi:hypothetical protein
MRQEIDSRLERRLQSVWWPIRGNEMSTGAAPARRSDESWPNRSVDRVDDIEGREESALDTDVRRCDTGERDDLAVLVRTDIEHAPPAATYADVLRNLHRASAARVQKMPREKSRGNRINDLRSPSGAEPT